MLEFKRRQFLQFAGSTLAAIGLSQLDLIRQANQYNRVVAQNTRGKLALLVGINNYPIGISSLRGCLNDVQMQYELLVHRYGFNPKDIRIVTDDFFRAINFY
ncbi:MAG: caspase family protein [Moorea sp. SIO2B7]|nr:caspase family protein [Moorena sp. SIO2B7]